MTSNVFKEIFVFQNYFNKMLETIISYGFKILIAFLYGIV